jgi:hypothetical protein
MSRQHERTRPAFAHAKSPTLTFDPYNWYYVK